MNVSELLDPDPDGGRRCLDVPLTGYTARLNSDREQAAWVLDILEANRRDQEEWALLAEMDLSVSASRMQRIAAAIRVRAGRKVMG